MPERPSEPILAWFRQALRDRGMNTAALANQVGEKRGLVRRVLSGREPLTVDQMVAWSQALELSMEDLARFQGASLPEDAGAPAGGAPGAAALKATPEPPSGEPDPYSIDPYGLQGAQAIRLGFALGVDFAFVADARQLADSGVPASVLEQWQDRLVIKLEAAYHRHNAPVFDERGLTLVLSFDTLYTCKFPWSAVLQVTFFVEPPPPAPDEDPAPEPEPEERGRPMLRLVKS